MCGINILTLLNRTYHFKGFVYDEVHWNSPEKKALDVVVRPRQGSQACCAECRKPCPGYDQLPMRWFRFVPLWGLQVFFYYARRRVQCPQHGILAEYLPWACGKHPYTLAFQVWLARWARRLSWKEVGHLFHVSWDTVAGTVEAAVEFGLQHRTWGVIESLGFDEVHLGAKRRFWTVVYQIDEHCRRLLWVGKDRTAATVNLFFDQVPPETRQGIRYVCSDLWRATLSVVRKRLPGALHILDRFHLKRLQSEALDQIRRREQIALHQAGRRPLLKNARWSLLRLPANWTPEDRSRMKDLLRHNLQTVRAWLHIDQFEQFWTYRSPTWAGKFLDAWCRRVNRSRLQPLQRVAKTFQRHRDLMLNWFRARKPFSNGVVEGFNNKLKLVTKRSYGFRSDYWLEIALYHNLGKLPEPKLTHEFF